MKIRPFRWQKSKQTPLRIRLFKLKNKLKTKTRLQPKNLKKNNNKNQLNQKLQTRLQELQIKKERNTSRMQCSAPDKTSQTDRSWTSRM